MTDSIHSRLSSELGLQNADDVLVILHEYGITRLESIVRDLVERDPVADIDPEYNVYVCLLCPDEHDEIYRSEAEVIHHEDCPWRLAREWVAAHPVTADLT